MPPCTVELEPLKWFDITLARQRVVAFRGFADAIQPIVVGRTPVFVGEIHGRALVIRYAIAI